MQSKRQYSAQDKVQIGLTALRHNGAGQHSRDAQSGELSGEIKRSSARIGASITSRDHLRGNGEAGVWRRG